MQELDLGTDIFRGFAQCLAMLSAKDISSTPLHVIVHVGGAKRSIDELLELLNLDLFPEPMTCKFLGVPCTTASFAWELAYNLGTVVHLDHAKSLDCNLAAEELATFIYDLIMEDKDNSPPGQLFLCDVPRLVLSTQELLAAANAHDAALLKLFALCEFDLAMMGREVQESRWEYFTARVKLVDAGYRPTKEEMEAIALRRSVFHVRLGLEADWQDVLKGSRQFLCRGHEPRCRC